MNIDEIAAAKSEGKLIECKYCGSDTWELFMGSECDFETYEYRLAKIDWLEDLPTYIQPRIIEWFGISVNV